MVSKASAPKKKKANAASKPQAPAGHNTSGPASLNASYSQKDQQTLLNVFSDAFANVLASEQFPTLLQEIKQALFNRDFSGAFGKEEYLEAYAARWSPTRALCYASVFLGVKEYADEMLVSAPGDCSSERDETIHGESADSIAGETAGVSQSTQDVGKRLKMLCVGGCAAEHVAFASYVQQTSTTGALTLLDSAPWTHVSSLLQNQITTAPPLSKYASASAKASSKPLIEATQLNFTFTQADALSLDKESLLEQVGSDPLLTTLMFTLNELYTEGGIGKTTKFLRTLGEVLPSGSLLLVVDSPGSYSEAAVGKEKKRYPMQWLLNHTLVESESSEYTWERLESEDSIWFRLPEGLVYPIQLENMRYQMHLYRVQKD